MPKILILDTYYPGVLDHLTTKFREYGDLMNYDLALRQTLDLQFGTADFYSMHLRNIGWDVRDVIVNFSYLQSLWATDRGLATKDVLHAQIEDFKPDVIFLQDLGLYAREGLERYRTQTFFAGQSSCAIRKDLIQHLRVIFTSFPHYVKKFNGVYGHRFVYNPLAFEPSVLNNISVTMSIPGGVYLADTSQVHPVRVRPLDIAFVGGVGNPSHWSAGLNVLEAVAETFGERFHWYGYGLETLPESSPLRQCYRGPAWGRKMYTVYSDAKIVINRHGEIAQGYSNNMRMYEATGCGALLVTEQSKNLHELFDFPDVLTYTTTAGAIDAINAALAYPNLASEAAARAQQRTLKEHTYHNRMKLVNDVLLERMK